MYRTNIYDNNGTLRNAIAADNRVKVIDYCRTLLTKIEFELIEEAPDETALRQHTDIITSALYSAFHNER